MEPNDFLKELQAKLRGRDPTDAKLLFLGILSKYCPPGAQPILVGGSLVEFYTLGAYTSADLDLVADRRVMGRLLLAAGFKERGRYFEHPDLPILVEFPGTDLRPTEGIATHVFEGYPFQSVRLIDAIVDRLLAAKFWESEVDWEQAILLVAAAVEQPHFDRDALRSIAGKNDVADSLEQAFLMVEGFQLD